MPVSMSHSEKEVLAALFIDDPRAVFAFLEELALDQAKEEPAYAKDWKKVGIKIEEARLAAKPLY